MRSQAHLVLAVAVLCSAAATAEEKAAPAANAPPAEQVVRVFTGRVADILYMTAYRGKAILVHFDPRFIVKVEVLKPETKDMEPAGSELVYAIHSPVQMFLVPREEAKGKVFRFTETETQVTVPGGAPRASHWLKATPVDAARDAGKNEESKK